MDERLPFYRLPLEARNLVYSYIDLTGRTVDLNFRTLIVHQRHEFYEDIEPLGDVNCFHSLLIEIARVKDDTTLEEYWECDYNPFNGYPYSLCRNDCLGLWEFIYEDWLQAQTEAPEVFKTMFRSNHFRICRSSPRGFAPLFELPSDAWRELGTLSVRLDGEPAEKIVPGGDWARLKELTPLNLRSRYGKAAMKDWEELVRRLAQCTRPKHLTLYLIVNALDLETAEAILRPLDQLPLLKGCGILLSRKPIPQFIELIQQTVDRLTNGHSKSYKNTPFRYLDLPQELRYRILECTDLVSKGDLEWKPRLPTAAPIHIASCSCADELGHRPHERGHLVNCEMESAEADPDDHYFPHIMDWGNEPSTAKEDYNYSDLASYMGPCYGSERYPKWRCSRTQFGYCECIFHREYSARSSNIIARSEGVHPLFLVSRQVRQDAIPVFFQRNRFFVTPPATIPARFADRAPNRLHIGYKTLHMQRLELPLFVSSLPREALRHIRYLEWILPQPENLQSAPQSALSDYASTIDAMAQTMNLAQLTLVLDLRALQRNSTNTFTWPVRSDDDRETYDMVLRPLCRLKGLKDCFVYLRRVPKERGSLGRGRPHREVFAYDNDEMRYEKAIMGRGYDSSKRGKPWMERFERKLVGDYCKVEIYGDY